MNIFESAVEDIFNVEQFIEYMTANGVQIKCVAYQVNTDTLYTEYGVDNGCSFYLTCKVKDYAPTKGNKITFRNKQYKIESYTADSFNLCWKLFLKELTSK